MENYIKPPVEVRYADELAALAASDTGKRPENWKLSPRAVRTFILGGKTESASGNVTISRKFYGNDALVELAIITLAFRTSCGCLLRYFDKYRSGNGRHN